MNTVFCPFNFVKINGTLYPRSRKFFYEFDDSQERQALEEKRRCNNCGVQAGFIHHVGCSCEECPECGMKFICCGCGNMVTTEPVADNDGSHSLDIDIGA